ncbi:MAG TPA: DUF5989 family protein [Candidatus Binatia bacterium]|nr:DUF5989 family protein [Candidatus Binatia bacterium]
MAGTGDEERSRTRDEFLAGRAVRSQGLLRDVLGFVRATQKWWLAPVIVGLLLIGLGLVLGGTAMAPFIYAAF